MRGWSALEKASKSVLRAAPKQSHSAIDQVYSWITHRTRFFPDGWGNLDIVGMFEEDLANMRKHIEGNDLQKQLPTPIHDLSPSWSEKTKRPSCVTWELSFTSPLLEKFGDLFPKESETASMLLVLPEDCEWHPGDPHPINVPTVIHFPGTGDHGYSRRLGVHAAPLAQQGVASVVLEGPYYGKRKPKKQSRSKLRAVTDLLVLGRATIDEGRSIVSYLKECVTGDAPLVTGGISMGGLHAAMVASLCPRNIDVGCVGHLFPPSAAPVFTDGVMGKFCAWRKLSGEDMTIEEAREEMRRVFALTDIRTFPSPKRPDAAIFLAAEDDCYVPPEAIHSRMEEFWPGCDVRWIPDRGHVSAFLLETDTFKKTVAEVMDNLRNPQPS